jgi:hypothetical protein
LPAASAASVHRRREDDHDVDLGVLERGGVSLERADAAVSLLVRARARDVAAGVVAPEAGLQTGQRARVHVGGFAAAQEGDARPRG